MRGDQLWYMYGFDVGNEMEWVIDVGGRACIKLKR